MSLGLVQESSYVDADPLVLLDPRRHPDAPPQPTVAELEDRLRLDDVLLDPAGHADDLGDPTRAAGSTSRWTTRSTDDATVGTTNRAEMFSPASSGRVHALVSASRALLAWIVQRPGSPLLSASSRSSASSARTSPTMIRLGRIRSDSLIRSRSRISPVPSSPSCRVWSATQSGCGKRISKTSSTEITRSPPGIAAAMQLSMVVFPAWVPPPIRRFRPARTEASRNSAADGVRLWRSTSSESRDGADHELADVDGREATADALEHDVEPVPLRKHRVDERATQVDPAPGGLEHPLDQLGDLGVGEHQVGQLVAPVARHEDPVGTVDPDLLDGRVVEQRLQRPEARDPGDQLGHHAVDVGDRRHHPGQAAVVVVADQGLGEAAYGGHLALRVEAVTSYGGAQLLVEMDDDIVLGAQHRSRGGWVGCSMAKTTLPRMRSGGA